DNRDKDIYAFLFNTNISSQTYQDYQTFITMLSSKDRYGPKATFVVIYLDNDLSYSSNTSESMVSLYIGGKLYIKDYTPGTNVPNMTRNEQDEMSTLHEMRKEIAELKDKCKHGTLILTWII